MGLPVACVDICILNGVAAMQHFSAAHIDTHMGNARCIVSADEKDQVARSCVGRGYRGGNIVESFLFGNSSLKLMYLPPVSSRITAAS